VRRSSSPGGVNPWVAPPSLYRPSTLGFFRSLRTRVGEPRLSGTNSAEGERPGRAGKCGALRRIQWSRSEPLDAAHGSCATDGTPGGVNSRQPRNPLGTGFLGGGRTRNRRAPQHGSAARQLLLPPPIRQQAVMADPHEPPFRGRVLRETQRRRAEGRYGKTARQPGILGYCHTFQEAGGSRCLASVQFISGPR